MPQLSHRVQTFTDSVIRRMTRINNQQPGSINLSQGFPDFDPPAEIMDALARAAHQGPHQYALTFGAANFRQALSDKYSPTFGRKIDPEREILVTCGSTEAMMAAVLTVCNPGDRIIVFSPFYENYGADAILSGAEPIFVPLIPPTFHFDHQQLEDAFRQGAKALILCNPSNPCGKVFTRAELEEIAALAVKYDAFVITDEVYEHIIFDGAVHIPMASLPGMWERTITCNSLSKTYSITGWRLGFILGPEWVLESAKKVHDFLTVGAAAPLQEAACVGLRFSEDYYHALGQLYARKREVLCSALEAQGWVFRRPQGSYFLLLDISEFLALDRFKGWTDLEFCEWMIREVGVAAVPGSSFFREPVNHLIRLHFARGEEVLLEAARRLGKLRALLK
ncbi:MAG: pyridoxal phosphate-dependent aminotransferase [Oscillospiraceae bacterium]|nr:pyridoxal phosphate-dependent aminotransferase [Oscillospiraceae bacterium]